jgi:hypothetical protein
MNKNVLDLYNQYVVDKWTKYRFIKGFGGKK